MRRSSLVLVVSLVSLSMVQAAVLKGTIAPGGRVTKVEALLRGRATMASINTRRFGGKFNPADGSFEIGGLEDGVYDLAVSLAEAMIEGVNLAVPDEDKQPSFTMNGATRKLDSRNFDVMKCFDPDEEVTTEAKLKKTMSKLRIAKLEEKIADVLKVARFETNNRPLWLHGTPDEARVLMELIRDTQFHSGAADEIIWRIEIWPFRWAAGGWDKPNKGVVVIDRVRTSRGNFEKMTRLFDPALGGLAITNNKDLTGFRYDLPDKLDASLGTVAK
jgi:hypothetical protein